MSLQFPITPPSSPATPEELVAADEVLANLFTFYGEKHQLPAQIDWTHNPGTRHWGHDLNRFTFLEPLVRAYQYTGERRYAEKVRVLIFSWIEQSRTINFAEPATGPYMLGSYLNVAIHLEHWLSSLAAIEGQSPGFLSDSDFETLKESVNQQLSWLDTVIPTKQNNWVQIGCRGVLVSLAYLPDFPQAKEWSPRAWQRMSDGIARQLLPDGVHDEMAVSYHFVVIRFALDALEVAGQTPTAPPEKLYGQVGSMLHYLRQMLAPDGKHIAAFNDSDSQRVELIQEVLQRPIVAQLLEKYRRPLQSECFPYAGIMVLREGEEQGRDELYLAFDGGSFGTGHQHEDKLGFWLCAYGRSFLIDPGRHLYDESGVSFWPFLRSTAAHSTITIDGLGQNSRAAREIPGAWRSEVPQPIIFKKQTDGTLIAGAFYDLGYGEDRIPVTHFRILFFFPDLKAWAIADAVEGDGTHTIVSRFQFSPGPLKADGVAVQTEYSDANLLLQGRAQDWKNLRIAEGETNPRQGWYSPGYNQIEPAPCALFSTGEVPLPWQSVTALVPYRGTRPDTAVVNESFARAQMQYSTVLDELRVMCDAVVAEVTSSDTD